MGSRSTKSVSGVAYAFAAFFSWGLLPIYWKLLSDVPALQIMLNRIVWSLGFLLMVLTVKGSWKEVRAVFRQPKAVRMLCCTACLISANWLTYIWAVNNGHIVESSLGYYINPLITVLLGVLVLKERPSRWQILAMVLAAIAVLYSVIRLGSFPWIALALAFTFALYGLLRKLVAVESLVGLSVETALLSPLALGVLFWLGLQGDLALGRVWKQDLLLAGAGVVTALPLIWFTCGTRRLQLSTIGFLQYVAPTCQLLIGVLIYHEPFPRDQQATFGLIWVALLIFSMDSLLRKKRS